jgi:hypothetical protein
MIKKSITFITFKKRKRRWRWRWRQRALVAQRPESIRRFWQYERTTQSRQVVSIEDSYLTIVNRRSIDQSINQGTHPPAKQQSAQVATRKTQSGRITYYYCNTITYNLDIDNGNGNIYIQQLLPRKRRTADVAMEVESCSLPTAREYPPFWAVRTNDPDVHVERMHSSTTPSMFYNIWVSHFSCSV